jgi:hypothetical protein
MPVPFLPSLEIGMLFSRVGVAIDIAEAQQWLKTVNLAMALLSCLGVTLDSTVKM